MLDATKINWPNCWRITFILLLLALFAGMAGYDSLAHFLGGVGGVAFIFMLVIRFDDFTEFMDSGNRRGK
jgi:hypothetical protein